MKNIYTWAAKPAKRTLTVGDLKAAKGKRKFTQVTANSVEEAEAAEKAGFDMIISCLLYTSPSPRDAHESRMPSSA